MRLYKMELYKLCHKKFFIWGFAVMAAAMLYIFYMQLMNEASWIDGLGYTGYSAVQADRRITEEFKGVMTDEKVQRIVEKYGYEQFLYGKLYGETNFLSEFILDYLAVVSEKDLEKGKITYVTKSLDESDLGKVTAMTGKGIVFEYYKGWQVFVNVSMVGLLMGSILLIFDISSMFSGEKQSKMLPLLFTSAEGAKKDVYAKLAAAFTIVISLWLFIMLFALLMCGSVYGLDGLNCYDGLALSHLWPEPSRIIPMYKFILIQSALSFLSLHSLCAVTLFISACCKNNFNSVTIALAYFGLPVLVLAISGELTGILEYIYAAPVFIILYMIIFKGYNILGQLSLISAAVFVIFACAACLKYGRVILK